MLILYTKVGCQDSIDAKALLKQLGVKSNEFVEVVVYPDAPPPELESLGWKGGYPFVVATAEDPGGLVLASMAREIQPNK